MRAAQGMDRRQEQQREEGGRRGRSRHWSGWREREGAIRVVEGGWKGKDVKWIALAERAEDDWIERFDPVKM